MTSSSPNMLPRHPPTDSNAYVEITHFATGQMVTPTSTLVDSAQGSSMGTSWHFLLKHVPTGTDFWFDMGISHDLSVYPPAIQKLHGHFKPTPSMSSLESDTLSKGAAPNAVKYVIISHAHWDHIYPLPSSFTNCTMIVGPDISAHYSPVYPHQSESKHDGRIWDHSLRTFPLTELPPTTSTSTSTSTSTWKLLGPFPHTYDFFNDGSFYLINAQSHMTGNLAALARIKTKPGSFKYLLLGGDCGHGNTFTYWPEAPFGRMPKALFPSGCLHEDAESAREMIRKIAECKNELGEGLLVWWAHAEVLEGAWEL